jgi:hypothetical protein
MWLSCENKNFLIGEETIVRKAIASYAIIGKFTLMHIKTETCYMYECETDDEGLRFRINSFGRYSHQLKEVFGANLDSETLKKYSLAYFYQDEKYGYDEYYNNLCPKLAEHNKAIQQSFCNLPTEWKEPSLLCIDGDFSKYPSVIYALQKNARKIYSMRLKSFQNESYDPQPWFPKDIKEKIATNGSVTLFDCLNKSQNIFVPLENSSLDSTFFRGIKWSDIMPNMNKDCNICGVDCKCIWLKVEVDGFQNIFCKATDVHGNFKDVWLYNTLSLPFENV